MFLVGKIQYSPTQNQFNSFNIDKESKRKSPEVSLSLKKLVPLRIPLVLLDPLRAPLRTSLVICFWSTPGADVGSKRVVWKNESAYLRGVVELYLGGRIMSDVFS